MVNLDNLSKCGHDKALHYQYVLNGRDQWRCKWCAPLLPPREGDERNFVMTDEMAARSEMADHDFVPLEARPEVVEFMQKVKDCVEHAHGHLNGGLTPPEALGRLTVRKMVLVGYREFLWEDEIVKVEIWISAAKR